jgi:hypothetical protein
MLQEPLAGCTAGRVEVLQVGVELEVLSHGDAPPSAGWLHGVTDSLDPDEAVTEDEGVDAVFDAVAATLGAPLQEEDLAFVDGGLDVPGRLRDRLLSLTDAPADLPISTEDSFNY